MSRLLIVVDVQVALVVGGYAVPNSEDFLSRWGARIEEAREEGTPVMFVQNDGQEPWDDAPGHPGWELYFKPLPTERVVRKTTKSVFESNPHLAGELRAGGFEELEMIGLQSELCVFESSKSALSEGFKVVLPEGMHATYDSKGVSAAAISNDIQRTLEELGATNN